MRWREYSANIVSQLSFYWARYLLKKAQIKQSTVDKLDNRDKSITILNKFNEIWNECKDNDPSLFKISMEVVGNTRTICLLSSMIILKIIGAIIWILFYDIFQNIFEEDSGILIEHIGVILGLLLIRTVIRNYNWYGARIYGTKVRHLVMIIVLDKCLRINSNNIEAGHVLNMLSKDAQTLYDTVFYVFSFIPLVISLLIFIVVMAVRTGNYVLFNWLAVVIVMFVICAAIATVFGALKVMGIQYTDES